MEENGLKNNSELVRFAMKRHGNGAEISRHRMNDERQRKPHFARLRQLTSGLPGNPNRTTLQCRLVDETQ